MVNILGGMDSDTLTAELNGTWLAKIDKTWMGTDKKDSKVKNLKIEWIVIDEDSPFFDETGDEWYKIYDGYDEAAYEAASSETKKKIKKSVKDLKARLIGLGYSEDDLTEFDPETMEGTVAKVTWNNGWIRNVELLKDDDGNALTV